MQCIYVKCRRILTPKLFTLKIRSTQSVRGPYKSSPSIFSFKTFEKRLLIHFSLTTEPAFLVIANVRYHNKAAHFELNLLAEDLKSLFATTSNHLGDFLPAMHLCLHIRKHEASKKKEFEEE